MDRLAVIISGVPRGNRTCAKSLQSFVRRFNTDIYCVVREEFLNLDGLESIKSTFPDVKIIQVPNAQSPIAEGAYSGYATTTVKMWHEIKVGVLAIPLERYDYVMRTRPDIVIAPGKLTIGYLSHNQILIPDLMSFSGYNDMIAVGRTGAMKRFCTIYDILPNLVHETGGCPEFIVACGTRKLGLNISPLDIDFCLYREEILGNFTEDQLIYIAGSDTRRHASYKIGGKYDTVESRKKVISEITNEISVEHLFPIFSRGRPAGGGFYPAEIDKRDGSPFRFMHMHAAIWRDFDLLNEINFKIHYRIPDFDPQLNLRVQVEGVPLKVEKIGIDKLGRLDCIAKAPYPIVFDGFRAKIGFFTNKQVIPAEVVKGSKDHRILSIAVGNPILV